jgi:hypothetical protein
MRTIAHRLRTLAGVLALSALPLLASSQQARFEDPLLEEMLGEWVLTGTITDESTTHDVKVEWVLNHQWVRIHERSREQTPSGEPQYEANVYIGWHGERKEYVVHWIDVFGGAFADVGHAKREGDQLPFVFQDDDGTFHTTFSFDRATKTWKWTMDSVSRGQSMDQSKPFARLTMTRREDKKRPE